MNFFISAFKWVMLVSGLLTCTMFLGLFAPESSLISNFGEPLSGPVAAVIVRNWSTLIGLMGMMLIYGSFVEPVRNFALIFAGLSKVIFICLVLMYGRQFMSYGAGTAVIVDTVMVIIFAIYLVATKRN